MNASFAEVPVVRRDAQRVTGEDAIESAQEFTELRRRHRGVLGARPATRPPRDERARAEAGLANLPDRGLLARARKTRDADALANPSRFGNQTLGALARFFASRSTKLDDQKGA